MKKKSKSPTSGKGDMRGVFGVASAVSLAVSLDMISAPSAPWDLKNLENLQLHPLREVFSNEPARSTLCVDLDEDSGEIHRPEALLRYL